MSYPLPGISVAPSAYTGVVVSITTASGTTPTVYADKFGVTTVTMPDTISAPKTYFVPAPGAYAVSAKVSGTEMAGGTVTVSESQVATVNLGPTTATPFFGETLGTFAQGNDPRFAPLIGGLTVNVPTDNGVQNRKQIELFLSLYGVGQLPAGTIMVDRAILITGQGSGLIGVQPMPGTSEGAISNLVETRIVPATGDGYAANAATAKGTLTSSTDTATFVAGSTTMTDASVASGYVGCQIIDPNVPVGTYITSVNVGAHTAVMSQAALTSATTAANTIIGPNVWYSVVQLGDDNVSNGNFLRYIDVDAGTTCGAAVFNATNSGYAWMCAFTGGTAYCLDSSSVGGNSPLPGGGGQGANFNLYFGYTDNTANFTASTPGGCFNFSSGKCKVWGGTHSNGYKRCHSSEMRVTGGYWKMIDNTAVTNPVPHVDVFENVAFSGATFEGLQGVAMFKRHTRSGTSAPVTLTFDSGCTFIPAGGSTPNLPMVKDLQTGSQVDPIVLAGTVMQFQLSSNSGGTAPFSCLVDDPRATYVYGLTVDGGAVGLFNAGTASFTSTQAIDSVGTFSQAHVGAQVTSVGTAGHALAITTLTVTSVSSDGKTLTGSAWSNGTPNGTQFWVSQPPNPVLSTVFNNGSGWVPAYNQGLCYQITFTGTPTNVMIPDATNGVGVGSSYFGDGNDGAMVLDGTLTGQAGMTTSGSGPNVVYTLSRDIYPTSFLLSGGTLVTNGFGVFASAYIVFSGGTVQDVGTPSSKDASGATAGTGAPGGSLGAGGTGVSGNSGNGAQGGAVASGYAYLGGSAGAGGTGSGHTAGGATTTVGTNRPRQAALAACALARSGTGMKVIGGGPAGGSGGGDGTGSGGGGGSGGGCGLFCAPMITFGSSTWTNGFRGGAGGNAQATNCGGGGGGGGGLLVFVSHAVLSGSPPTAGNACPGGAAGTSTGSGGTVTAGSNGAVLSLSAG